MRKFTASRISKDNALFPPQIILDEDNVIVKCPGLFLGKSTSIPYDNISYVSAVTPIIGFSTISFIVHGEEVTIHGFTKSEVKEIEKEIAKKRVSKDNY